MRTMPAKTLLIASATVIALFSACGKDGPSAPAGGASQLRFHNSMTTQTVGGSIVRYKIRNLSTLNVEWTEEVNYGYSSSYQSVESRTTDFTILGEICPEQGGTWIATQWTKQAPMKAGSSNTVELTFEQ